MRVWPHGSSARLTLLEHDRYPMAWEQLFGSLEGLGLISSEDRRHGDALGQVSDYVEQQAHGWCGQLMVVYDPFDQWLHFGCTGANIARRPAEE